MGSKQTHVTVAEYISAFFFKYCSYGYGTTMAENAEKGADALLGMLRLVWQKGGREDMNTAFYSFKEQLVAARSMLPALQQLRVDCIFMLLEALLDAAEKLRQFSPYKEGAVLSGAVLTEARGRLHRILVGDAFAGDHYVRRRALECCYSHLVREQGARARTMERQLRMPLAPADAKPGRGRFGSSSGTSNSSLLRSLGGPDLSSWQGLWEALGSMSGARMLPLLESALADAASARQQAAAATTAAASAAAAAAATAPRSSRHSADGAAAITSVRDSSAGTAASKEQSVQERAAVAVVAAAGVAQPAAAGTSNTVEHSRTVSPGTSQQQGTSGSSSTGQVVDPSGSIAAQAAGAATGGTPLKAAAAAAVGPAASRRSSTSEWAATDSEPTTHRSSSFADELVREQQPDRSRTALCPVERTEQVPAAIASSPAGENLDWAQFPSSNSVGCSTAADTATADTAVADNGAGAGDMQAGSKGAAAGTGVATAAVNSKPGGKLQVHVQDAADAADVGGLDVSPFDMDSPVNWSTDLPACAQQLQQLGVSQQEQLGVCHTTHTIDADAVAMWPECNTAVA